jgi:hypothetical protein
LVFGTAPATVINLDSEKDCPAMAKVAGNDPVDLPLRLDDADARYARKLVTA